MLSAFACFDGFGVLALGVLLTVGFSMGRFSIGVFALFGVVLGVVIFR